MDAAEHAADSVGKLGRDALTGTQEPLSPAACGQFPACAPQSSGNRPGKVAGEHAHKASACVGLRQTPASGPAAPPWGSRGEAVRWASTLQGRERAYKHIKKTPILPKLFSKLKRREHPQASSFRRPGRIFLISKPGKSSEEKETAGHYP